MKYTLFLLLGFLTGCGPYAKETRWPVMPEGLQDCKIYNLSDGNGHAITVARCPLSATTVKNSNKIPATSITIDRTEAAK
jgi:hypothetical protein